MKFPTSLQHLIREDEPLAPYTWLQIGGAAKFFAEPNNLDELRVLLRAAFEQETQVRMLGGGSNILVRDQGFDGLAIHLETAELTKITVDGERLIARGGAKLNHVISQAVGAGLSGLEHLAGIPGTLGGAVVCNSGVTNDDIGSHVSRVTVIDRDGKLIDHDREYLQFGFRRSNLEGAIVAEVELKLESVDSDTLTRRMQANWIVKRAAQPPSSSRTALAFIEPDGVSLAEVLEAAGMRDLADGEVTLSKNHPGYLVVAGHASSDQVISLIERVVKAVEVRCGIQLQPQLKFW